MTTSLQTGTQVPLTSSSLIPFSTSTSNILTRLTNGTTSKPDESTTSLRQMDITTIFENETKFPSTHFPDIMQSTRASLITETTTGFVTEPTNILDLITNSTNSKIISTEPTNILDIVANGTNSAITSTERIDLIQNSTSIIETVTSNSSVALGNVTEEISANKTEESSTMMSIIESFTSQTFWNSTEGSNMNNITTKSPTLKEQMNDNVYLVVGGLVAILLIIFLILFIFYKMNRKSYKISEGYITTGKSQSENNTHV